MLGVRGEKEPRIGLNSSQHLDRGVRDEDRIRGDVGDSNLGGNRYVVCELPE